MLLSVLTFLSSTRCSIRLEWHFRNGSKRRPLYCNGGFSTQQHRGRVLSTWGDSVLPEFASLVDAVRCAVGIQEELKDRNRELPENRYDQGVRLEQLRKVKDRVLRGYSLAAIY